jgi:hypothetical protein
VPIVSMQRGGGSKDTWVLSDGPCQLGDACDAGRVGGPAGARGKRPAEPRRRETCSGWGATPSAPSMRFGSCAASSRA